MFYGNSKTILRLYSSASAKFHILKGPQGIGKRMVANALVRSYLCQSNKVSCECSSCRKLKSGNHPDFFCIQLPAGEKSIKVENIYPILKESNFRPISGRYKVVLVDDADRLTVEAQNKLLKTLEDSSDFMKFIFIAHGDLLKTIESRGLVHKFYGLATMEMCLFLKTITDDDVKSEILLNVSDGCPGTAARLANNDRFFEYIKTTVGSILKGDLSMALNTTGLMREKDNSVFDVLGGDILPYLIGLRNFVLDLINIGMGQRNKIAFKLILSESLVSSPVRLAMLLEMFNRIEKLILDCKNNVFVKEELLNMFNYSCKIQLKEVGYLC